MTNIIQAHLMVDIQAILDQADPLRTENCHLCRVPYEIRRLNEVAYTPKVVSIGPLHHLDSKLQDMESHKSVNFKKFVQRATRDFDANQKETLKQKLLENLVNLMQEIEPEVRLCYSETLKLTKKELCKVILVDASFIIELFLTYYYEDTGTINDAILFTTPWLATRVRLDLLLFENQLPFFAIERLYNLVFTSGQGSNGGVPSFIELAFDYFKYYSKRKLEAYPNLNIMHFTDLLRTFHLQTLETLMRRENETVDHLPSATELRQAGVKFEVKESQCLLDLEFSKGVLKIPQLPVNDWTETLFRNMIALEQCECPFESYITDYVVVMDFLINTREDVDLLLRKEIIHSWLGDSDAAANLFNGLSKNVTLQGFTGDYYRLCKQLNDFYRSPCANLKASLRRDYCKTTWMTLATLAAITILILTAIQAICSVMQVAQKK